MNKEDVCKQINQLNDILNTSFNTTGSYSSYDLDYIKQYASNSKKLKQLENILSIMNKLQSIQQQLNVCNISNDQQTLQYVQILLQEKSILEQQLNEILMQKDPLDESTEIILEIRAGAGGDEGALFAYDLFRMYQLYAKRNGWNVYINLKNEFSTQNDQIGIKKVILTITGEFVYKKMKFQSGIHRVIRNPITDAGDRTHTSSATVAVLPVISDVQFELNMNDLRIDFYRGTGKGGQHRNTTDSACRIVHIPTGLMVTCEDERSQFQNKDKALTQIRSRLYNQKLAQQESNISQKRKQLVGRGDWANRIRTYNFKKQQFYDHRINYVTTQIYDIMSGNLDQLILNLQTAYKKQLLENV